MELDYVHQDRGTLIVNVLMSIVWSERVGDHYACVNTVFRLMKNRLLELIEKYRPSKIETGSKTDSNPVVFGRCFQNLDLLEKFMDSCVVHLEENTKWKVLKSKLNLELEEIVNEVGSVSHLLQFRIFELIQHP
mmetsp:Transcript_9639/g.17368  ORF Transcript_9639/g.17368 Transcript_9639/m.17368 type:complete len:134 (+) Transcript_9639:1090-1491(+)